MDKQEALRLIEDGSTKLDDEMLDWVSFMDSGLSLRDIASNKAQKKAFTKYFDYLKEQYLYALCAKELDKATLIYKEINNYNVAVNIETLCDVDKGHFVCYPTYNGAYIVRNPERFIGDSGKMYYRPLSPYYLSFDYEHGRVMESKAGLTELQKLCVAIIEHLELK